MAGIDAFCQAKKPSAKDLHFYFHKPSLHVNLEDQFINKITPVGLLGIGTDIVCFLYFCLICPKLRDVCTLFCASELMCLKIIMYYYMTLQNPGF
jgi:hypothetical protein